jgi:hypothetical protein
MLASVSLGYGISINILETIHKFGAAWATSRVAATADCSHKAGVVL